MASLALDTLVGPLTVSESEGAIVALTWGRPPRAVETALLRRAIEQLAAYFAGQALEFDLPLAPHGTDFQKRAWSEMSRIPFGRTRSYGELAAYLESAPRAVGGACGANPIPIIIPCHRVLAAKGRPGGYSGRGGLETKRILLAHEARLVGRP